MVRHSLAFPVHSPSTSTKYFIFGAIIWSEILRGSYYKPETELSNCQPSSVLITLAGRGSINCVILADVSGQQLEGRQIVFPRGNVLLSVKRCCVARTTFWR